jgi:hypothetical protein
MVFGYCVEKVQTKKKTIIWGGEGCKDRGKILKTCVLSETE